MHIIMIKSEKQITNNNIVRSMETRSAKRKKLLNSIPGADRISDLPDEILHHILSKLPIRSIAQTGVLSKRWRQLWHSFPDLDFSSSTLNCTIPGKGFYSWMNRGADSVNQVLAHRDKRCDIRVLRFRAWLSFSRLNALIRRAIKHNVQELDIEFSTDDYFNFPRCVITSESLRFFRLKSQYPGFRLPPPVILKNGFRSLLSLFLSSVMLYDQPSLLNLFDESSFPMLKNLILEMCTGLKHLNIFCRGIQDIALKNCFDLENLQICIPKLETLTVLSCFDPYSTSSWVKIDAPKLETIYWSDNSLTEDSVLENLSSLDEALVGFLLLRDRDINATKLGSISRFFSGISHCQFLTLETQCIEILSKNYHRGLLQPFNRLKSLELSTGFKKHNLQGLAYLFRNSPHVETLVVNIFKDQGAERRKWNGDLREMSSSGEERFWELQSQDMKSFLHHLRVVKFIGFCSGCENDIVLVNFLLNHGKVLQELFLCLEVSKSNARDSLQREMIKSHIMEFSPAAFSNVKIIFE